MFCYAAVLTVIFSVTFVSTQLPKTSEPEVSTVFVPPTRDTYHVLGEFSRLAHELSSGNITVVNKKSFYIPNLSYDGKGPDAHFWAGNGTAGPNEHGVLVPNEKGSRQNLKGYTNENIFIILPEPLTVDNIEYLGVWCIKYKHNFGYVKIPKNLNVPPALSSEVITIEALSNEKLETGPIAILDNKTLFVPSVRRKDLSENITYCFGTSVNIKPVTNTQGESEYVKLPKNFDIYSIDTFGVCENGKYINKSLHVKNEIEKQQKERKEIAKNTSFVIVGVKIYTLLLIVSILFVF